MIDQVKIELESCLRHYGWQYQVVNQTQIVTGWQGAERSYPLRIEICDSWLELRVEPFLGILIDWDTWPELAVQLLKMNDSSSFVRLSIAGDGRICLNCEVLCSTLSFEVFDNTIGLIGHYSDIIYDQILEVMDQIGYNYCEPLNILT